MADLTFERPEDPGERPETEGTGLLSVWASRTFDAFRVPTYRILWLGTALAFLAFNMASTAQGVVAFDLTGSNRAVGLVLAGQGLAMCVLNPFGGAIADRFSKRLLLLLAQTIIGGVMLATALLILSGRINVTLLTLGSFMVGSMFAFNGPTRTAMVGEVVPDERVGNAMALMQVGGNLARISGPFLAGALLAWPVVGSAGVYFIIAAIFIVVIGTMYRIPPGRPTQKRETSVLQDVRLGFRYILHSPRLLHCVISFHLVTVLGLSYFVLMPAFAKEVLDAGTAGLGIMLGVSSAGGLAMSLIVASLADSKRAAVFLTAASFCSGIALMLLSIAPTFAVAVLVMVLVGGCSSAFQTLNNVVALSLTDADYYGRVMGVVFLAWGLNSFVSLPIGFVADIVGVRNVLFGLGFALCNVVLLLLVWRRRIYADEERWSPGAAPA